MHGLLNNCTRAVLYAWIAQQLYGGCTVCMDLVVSGFLSLDP